MDELSERDAALLEFERGWWKYSGEKDRAVRARFGLSSTAYYAELSRVIELPEAAAADPLLVRRLRRLRDRRRAVRSAARLDMSGHRMGR